MLSDIRKHIALFEGPQASPVSTSGRRNIGAKMITEHWCNDTDRRKSAGEKTCPTVTFWTTKLTLTCHTECERESVWEWERERQSGRVAGKQRQGRSETLWHGVGEIESSYWGVRRLGPLVFMLTVLNDEEVRLVKVMTWNRGRGILIYCLMLKSVIWKK
jgi:hypothetical protein